MTSDRHQFKTGRNIEVGAMFAKKHYRLSLFLANLKFYLWTVSAIAVGLWLVHNK